MTDTEKRTAEKMRAEGCSYNMISQTLGISLSTVKSHIRRRAKKEPQIAVVGKPSANTVVLRLSTHLGIGRRLFYSKSCQERYWREHRNISLCASLVSCTCPGCGKEILNYKGHNRKYCSHQCYIAVRYGMCGKCGRCGNE